MSGHRTGDDEVLSALDELLAVLADRRHIERIAERADRLRARRLSGGRYREIVEDALPPLIVELLSDHIKLLTAASARFRRAEAAALRAEGMTMQQIAELFGVSRQRISALLSGYEEGRS